jgi:hypothetical protein
MTFLENEMNFFGKSSVSGILYFIVLFSSEDMVLRGYRKYTTDMGKMCNLCEPKIYVNSTVVGVIISDLFFS